MPPGARPRLLVLGPLPPPPGGGETVTRVLIESPLNERYTLRHFDTTRRRGKRDIGRFTAANAAAALGYLRGLRRELASFRPAIVHMPVSSARPALVRDWLFARAVRGAGARLVFHSHGGGFQERYEASAAPWRQWVRRVLGQPDVLLCLTPGLQSFFDRLDLKVTTVVVPNPVDPEFEARLTEAQSPAHTGVRVLYVGAICRPKGVVELLSALDQVIDANPELHARLVGGEQYPGDWQALQAMHRSLRHRAAVELTGPRFDAALAAEYAAADFLVLPSYFEAMPMVIVEAMAAGLPVVATRVGGIPDMITDGEGGLLVEPRDVGALAGALERLANDPELRRRMGARNRQLAAERYSQARFVETVDAIYRQLITD